MSFNAVESAFDSEADYAMLVMIYGNEAAQNTKYGQAKSIDCKQKATTTVGPVRSYRLRRRCMRPSISPAGAGHSLESNHEQ